MKTVLVSMLFMAALGTLTACASVPKPGELDNLARVHFGEKVPANQDYVLVFDAGQKIPLSIQIDGGLIARGLDERDTVTLKKTIYTYKKWASFDGYNWIDARKLINLSLKVKFPGYKNPNPGLIHIKLEEKKS